MRRLSTSCVGTGVSMFLIFCVVNVSAQPVNVCDRSPEVVFEIEWTSKFHCAHQTVDRLLGIKNLNLINEGITSLKSGDFDGLTNLELLRIDQNLLTSLPENIFAGLPNLETLNLSQNPLTDLDEDLFQGLSSLKNLALRYTSVTSLDEDLFDGLTNLTDLWLNHNSFNDLDPDLFDGLTNLRNLFLSNNLLTTLDADLFDGLQSGLEITLLYNPIICLPQKIIDLDEAGTITVYGLGGMMRACQEPVVTLSLSHGVILEGEFSTITANLNIPTTETTTITILAEATPPALDSDYTLSENRILTIDAGATTSSGAVTITAVDDQIDGPDKEVTVSGIVTNADAVTSPEDVILTITDDDDATTVTITVEPTEVMEHLGSVGIMVTATLDVARSTDTPMTVLVEEGTATAGTDYAEVSPIHLTIAAHETSQRGSFSFTPIEDDMIELNETVYITTSVDGLSVIEAILSILDPPPEVSLELTPEVISEVDGQAAISARLSAPSSEEISLAISAAAINPAIHLSYTLGGNPTLTIPAGQTISTGTVTIMAVDNEIDEPDKMVTISGQVMNAEEVTDPEDVTLTITDDDEATTVTLTVVPPEIDEDVGREEITMTAALDVARSTDTDLTILVESGTAMSGADFIAVPSFPLTIRARERERDWTFSFTPITDGVDEPDETAWIRGTAVDGLQVTGTELILLDTDPIPEVTLGLTPESVPEANGHASVTARLSSASSAETIIEISARPDSPATHHDYSLSSNTTLRIAPGITTSTGDVLITAVDNRVDAPHKTVTVSGRAENLQGVTGPSDVTLTILEDDEATGILLALDPFEVKEDAGSTRITVIATLDVLRTEETEVTISVRDGSAVAGDDYEVVSPIDLTIPANQPDGRATFDLTVLDDLLHEPEETITITGESSALGPGETETSLTILDNDPVITLAIQDTVVSEDVGDAQILIKVTPAAPIELSVPVQTIAESATEGQDYMAADEILLIPAGRTTAFLQVPIIDDPITEPAETFQVRFAELPGTVLDPGVATVTIQDNDVYRLRVQDAHALESSEVLMFEVTLDPPHPLETIRVAYTTQDGTAFKAIDYTHQSDTLIFPSGSIRQVVSVPILSDEIEEMTETFLLELSAPDHAELAKAVAIGTILDDDSPPTVHLESLVRVREDAGIARFEVTLSYEVPEGQEIHVEFVVNDVSANNPSDYRVQTLSPLQFASGEAVKFIEVKIVDDTFYEGDETFQIKLTDVAGGELGQSEGEGVIVDNEALVTVRIQDMEVTESEPEVIFPVVLSGKDSRPRTFAFTTGDGTATAGEDYEAATGTISFAPGDLRKNITVPIRDDLETEPTETFHVRLTGADLSDLEATGTILDDDGKLTVSIYDEQASEGDGSLLFPVRLSRPSSRLVTVQFASSDETAEEGSDYVSSQGIVIFQRGSTEGKIRIQILEDSEVEADETFQVTLSNARHAEIAQETGTGTILDNDGNPTVSVQSVTASRRVAVFDMHLSKPSPLPILISYATEDGSAYAGEDYEPLAGQVAFEPGEVSKTIEVKLLSSERIWEAKTFSLILLSAINAEVAQARTEAVVEEESEESIQNAYVSRVLRTWASQVVDAFSRRMEGMAQCSIPDLSWLRYGTERRSLGDIFRGCGAAYTQGGWSVWGQGAFTRMRGSDGALSLRSNVTTILLGADYVWRQGWMAGLLAAQSWDQGTYETPARSGSASSRLTGFYPYVSYQTGAGMRAWLLLGLGRGETEVETLGSELDAALVALGVTGTLTGGTSGRLGYEIDAFWATANLENRSDLEVRRVRAGVEGSLRLGAGMQPYLETTLRQDGGDAETGMGIELGGGVRWSTSQLRAEVGGRTLVLHTDEGLREWGLMGAIEYGNPGGPGPSMQVRPLWGNVYGGELWREAPLHSMGLGNTDQRVELELGYGTPIRKSLGRSIVGMTLDPSGRAYRIGYNLRMRQGLQVSVATTARTMEANETPHSYGLSARMDMKW